VQRAVSLAAGAAPSEQALIHALTKRYQNPGERDHEILTVWQWQFADAMVGVYRAHQDDRMSRHFTPKRR